MLASSCGSAGVIDVSNMTEYNFSSPGYPYGYKTYLSCEWIFHTNPENHLRISFVDINLETYSGRCSGDKISVYTGRDDTTEWDLVNSFCLLNASYFNNIPISNMMKVVFTSDSFKNETGFLANIYNGRSACVILLWELNNSVLECGGTLRDSNGVIAITNATILREDEITVVVRRHF